MYVYKYIYIYIYIYMSRLEEEIEYLTFKKITKKIITIIINGKIITIIIF